MFRKIVKKAKNRANFFIKNHYFVKKYILVRYQKKRILSPLRWGLGMLDRQKLLKELSQIDQRIFGKADDELVLAQTTWKLIQNDDMLAAKLQAKKWSVLVPLWQGALGKVCDVQSQSHPYQVLAVDGSQIYYDRHQGPACYLINVGSVFFSYGLVQSIVKFESTPSVVMSAGQGETCNAEGVNLAREKAELTWAVCQARKIVNLSQNPFLCLFDGTLIFFQADGQTEQKEQFLIQYFQHLQALCDEKILHVGYISFPRSKELVNILKLVIVDFEDKKTEACGLHKLTDMDVVQFFLQSGQRSIVFESKAPVCYLYPKHLKPYFCYLNVGQEIARLEFPAWIAQDQNLVNQICGIVLDQASKGNGYPVCLFEAHEQAVVKACDRDFFYHMIQKMTQQQAGNYQISKKSLKKAFVPV